MNTFLEDYFTFYYVGVALFALGGVLVLLKWFLFRKPFKSKEPDISFKRLNNRFDRDLHKLEKILRESQSISKPILKLLKKAYKKEQKAEKSKKKEDATGLLEKAKEQLNSNMNSKEIFHKHSAKVYVLHFKGDILARATDQLRNEISLLLKVATPEDEIVICLNSPGGGVAQYGFASSQLARLKSAGLKLTACVDLIAASGGYMMASVADKIIASPFAFIGSIGVVAGIPNFHKVIQKHDIDYHLFTAGKHKRTITPFAEVTEEGKKKFQENLEDIHKAFKEHVSNSRQSLDIEDVATGDYWLATQAKEKGLVDEIMTSDDYLSTKMDDFDVIAIKTEDPRSWFEKMFQTPNSLLQQVINRLNFLETATFPEEGSHQFFR